MRIALLPGSLLLRWGHSMLRQVADAVISALEAEGVVAFDTGKVPKLPPPVYTVVSLSGSPDNYRLSSQHGQRRFRLLTMHVGTTAKEARWAAEHVSAALQDELLELDGLRSTRLRNESSTPVAADYDNPALFTGVDTWTFHVSAPAA